VKDVREEILRNQENQPNKVTTNALDPILGLKVLIFKEKNQKHNNPHSNIAVNLGGKLAITTTNYASREGKLMLWISNLYSHSG
jgi:hypothetical protein